MTVIAARCKRVPFTRHPVRLRSFPPHALLMQLATCRAQNTDLSRFDSEAAHHHGMFTHQWGGLSLEN